MHTYNMHTYTYIIYVSNHGGALAARASSYSWKGMVGSSAAAAAAARRPCESFALQNKFAEELRMRRREVKSVGDENRLVGNE